MGKLERYFKTCSPYALSLLRIVVAALFMKHGTQKLFGFPGGDVGQLNTLVTIAGVLEFGGGLLMLIGLAVRPVAFVLSGQMAVAYFMVHAPRGFYPALNGGEMAARPRSTAFRAARSPARSRTTRTAF